MTEIDIVRLGNALIKCPHCTKDVPVNPEMKYLYEMILRFQTENSIIFRASYNKLSIAGAILEKMYRFKIKEIERKKITAEGKEFIDILIHAD